MRPCSLRRIFGGARCFFVRRCGQTRRSCCINQLVSPRAVLVNWALARLFYDVTDDRPTIQKDTQKAEHTHSVCSAEKDAQPPHKPPLFRAEWRRTQWARRIGASYQYRTKRKVCSRPCAFKARPVSGAPYAIWPRVQLSGGRSLKINSHHAQPLSFQICFYYNRLRAGCQWQNRKKASSAASRASE